MNVEKAKLYIQRVKAELNKLDTAIDDLAYLLRENGHPQNTMKSQVYLA